MIGDFIGNTVAATQTVQTKGINIDGSLTTASLVTAMVSLVFTTAYKFVIRPGMNNVISDNKDVSELKQGFQTLTETLAGLSLEMAEQRGIAKGRAQVVAEQLKQREDKDAGDSQ